MSEKFSDIRREFTGEPLNEFEVSADPFEQFHAWLGEAIQANTGPWYEPNAMTLATVDADGQPDARIVLLKQIDERGLTFFTHATSQKGRQLQTNPRAAVVFYWGDLQRQVRVSGRVEQLPAEEADAYWATRPRGSQLGSAVSRQSTVIESREDLEDALVALRVGSEGSEVPRPASWAGYRIVPEAFEFWQGRENRLHDRIRYRRHDGGWEVDRLSP